MPDAALPPDLKRPANTGPGSACWPTNPGARGDTGFDAALGVAPRGQTDHVPANPVAGAAGNTAGDVDGDVDGDESGDAATDGPGADVTQWLSQWGQADPAVGTQLFERLYNELRRLARSHLRRENSGHTLSATALTHEAWFRMAEQTRTQWKNRGHFLAVASTMMRRILVNHEMARRAQKREAEQVALTLSGLEQIGAAPDRDLVAVHEALLAFEAVDPRAAKVVELRFFGGLENEEIADALGLSLATVKRDWTLARAWLQRDLAGYR